VPVDPWGHEFQYRYPGTKNTEASSTPYDLFSMGKDGKPDTEDDIGNW
jgi:general secretion pathway protein G